MGRKRTSSSAVGSMTTVIAVFITSLAFEKTAPANPRFRGAFFTVHPDAVGASIGMVPSNANHGVVWHWNPGGGAKRTPRGMAGQDAINIFPDTPHGRRQAIRLIRNDVPHGDGCSALLDVTATINCMNTRTFPGVSSGDAGSVFDTMPARPSGAPFHTLHARCMGAFPMLDHSRRNVNL